MASRIFENAFVAVVGAAAGAIASAIINNLLLKSTNINYWWVGALLGILVAVLFYFLYQQRFPVKKWRVTNATDGTGLGSRGKLVGRLGQSACQFETNFDGWAVWGPGDRCQEAIMKGKYKAIFRMKINHKSGKNLPIVEISVSARSDNGLGSKLLAGRTLTSIDFKEDDEYQDFPLYFEVIAPEHEFELRAYSKGDSRLVTLDYVQVSRRFF